MPRITSNYSTVAYSRIDPSHGYLPPGPRYRGVRDTNTAPLRNACMGVSGPPKRWMRRLSPARPQTNSVHHTHSYNRWTCAMDAQYRTEKRWHDCCNPPPLPPLLPASKKHSGSSEQFSSEQNKSNCTLKFMRIRRYLILRKRSLRVAVYSLSFSTLSVLLVATRHFLRTEGGMNDHSPDCSKT